MYQHRPYQLEAIQKLKQSIASGNRRVLLSLATGAGKSIIAHDIVKMAESKGNNVLFLAHRTILVDQMKRTLSQFDNVLIETVQTSKNRHYEDIRILIIDEAHWAANSPIQDKVIAKYPNAIIIGMSATPITHQGYALDGWDEVIDIVQLADLIEMGYASPVRVLAPASVDRSGFKITGGDYNGKDVAEEVMKNEIVSDVVGKYMKYGEGRRAIFYCVNIDHAEMLAADLTARGVEASSYHSKMSNREDVFNDFKEGKLHVLCSVESLTTGVDLPDIYCIVLATPTRSVIKAVQIYGRATRLDPKNPDKEALIIDCANVIEDTVHPLQKLDFNKKPEKKGRECACGGRMMIVKTSMTTPDPESGVYKKTTVYRCQTCTATETVNEDLVYMMTFCEECQEVIDRGTAVTKTEIKSGVISLISVCPHCQNERVIRSVKEVDVELEEKKLAIDASSINTWEDVERELRKAKDRYGKKYHPYWVKRVIPALQSEGFEVEEVKKFIDFYTKKGWVLGGIVQAMIKRRG